LLPWVAMALVVFTATVLWPNMANRPLPLLLLGFYVGLGLAADLGFAIWARRKLLSEFRLEAARRYEPRAGFWKRLLGGGVPRGVEPPPPES